MSELVSDKAKILHVKPITSLLMLDGKETEIIFDHFKCYLNWSVFRKFITKHFFISVLIQSTNNQNMSGTCLHINLVICSKCMELFF